MRWVQADPLKLLRINVSEWISLPVLQALLIQTA